MEEHKNQGSHSPRKSWNKNLSWKIMAGLKSHGKLNFKKYFSLIDTYKWKKSEIVYSDLVAKTWKLSIIIL